MLDDSGVGVELGALAQRDEVVAVLRVDEHHALTDLQLGGPHLADFLGVDLRAERESSNWKSTRTPAKESHILDFFSHAFASALAVANPKSRLRIKTLSSCVPGGPGSGPRRSRS